ncbi:MAG: glycosyltransferase family 2 protein [Roseburia sp.]|nr:glycosyltransferase family 2 protein [Roseburia sp.]MCM1235030.1 glycosyltransferase family 2 protein [Ruminococcus flavefaciens]
MYAPIIIPTLNRYDHLVRCIESLRRNPIARETELYISLDYPPAEKYIEGYERVKEYLENELVDGFKNIHKYYQQENLGPNGNSSFLMEQVCKVYDRYIFTEDDNEFSPNFLDYLNKGLDLFEADDNVFAICGYRNEKPWKFAGGNVAKICLFHAWGYATWRKKDEKCREWICRDNFMRLLHDKKACDLLYHTRYKAYYTFIESLLVNPTDYGSVYINRDGEIACIDYTIAIYMLLYSKCCVLPEISMVRNWGYDGTGVNCGKVALFEPMREVIDNKLFFEYCIPERFEEDDANKRLNKDADYEKQARRAKCFRMLMCTMGIPAARKLNNAMYIINSHIRQIREDIKEGKGC